MAYKKGNLSDDEKRRIESMIDLSNFAEIARTLNRNPATIRKYCQRKSLSNDTTSRKKYVENRAKHNHHLVVMQKQLTKEEYEFAIQVYKGMMDQFGNDIIYSEEVQIIEYCMITCLLNRTFSKEIELDTSIKEQRLLRSEWQKKKDDLSAAPTTGDDDDEDEEKEAEKYDLEDYYMDKIEQIDIRVADMQTEYAQVKKEQISFLKSKEDITNALNVSRKARANEITKVNQNFSDLIVMMRKNEEFRKQIGLELEKMRLGIKEEYIRLSQIHTFADNQDDYPVYNTEVVIRESKKDEK